MNMPSEIEPSKTEENISYFKLLFFGKFSKFTENWLQTLTKQFRKEGPNIKTVFSTFKLASLFSTKDKFPYGLKYVGKTDRHISTMTHEHLETDKNCNIYRHLLKNPQCKSICDESYFSILDLARTKYNLKLKKGMYTKWLKPSLNKPANCILISIFV